MVFCLATTWWVYSRTVDKAERLATKMHEQGRACKACTSLDELLALNPHFLVEAASPGRYERGGPPALRNGTSIITLSIGAFADTLYEEVNKTARAHDAKVYIASGATGGFDVLRTAALMGNVSAKFFNQKGVRALRGSRFHTPEMENSNQAVFSGTAREAIQTFPTGLNVAVAASLATVGPERLDVIMESTPDFVGIGSGLRSKTTRYMPWWTSSAPPRNRGVVGGISCKTSIRRLYFDC